MHRRGPGGNLGAIARGSAGDHRNVRYVSVLSDPEPGDHWTGWTGLVHESIVAGFPDLSDFEVFASGPPAMVYAGRDPFLERGLPAEQMFSDAFEFTRDGKGAVA